MAINKVITISRSFGSGGRTIGRLLADELGWNFYDNELLRLASDDSGISENLFAQADETYKKSLFNQPGNLFDGRVIPPKSSDFTSPENLFRYQAKVIRELAEKENCVIVGRCANYILRDKPNALRLYIHAPEEFCIREVMRMYGLSQQEAVKRIREIDKRRADYYKTLTGHEWNNADDYDMCIDTSRINGERCIRLVNGLVDVMI